MMEIATFFLLMVCPPGGSHTLAFLTYPPEPLQTLKQFDPSTPSQQYVFFTLINPVVCTGFAARAALPLLFSSRIAAVTCPGERELKVRSGRRGALRPPTSHTTVRAVRHTAVHEEHMRRRCSARRLTSPMAHSPRVGTAVFM